DREAAAGPRPRRLQPERVGTYAGIGVLGTPVAACRRVDTRHVDRGGARHRDRRLPPRQRAGPRPPTRGSVGTAARGEGSLRSRSLRLTAVRCLHPVRTMERHNVGPTERWASMIAGGALALYGLARRSVGGGILAA